MNATTARSRAIVTQDAAIQSNVAKIEEAKRRPSALEAMAARLNVSAGSLTSMLKNTVFKGASDAEFVALVVVSNAYGLNPLLKEIYAFPAKGGGIIPYVSVDGWTRIINEHPQFDGLEFNDIVDANGELYAIESVIYRRDRGRPIKITEYMDECKGTGAAWQKTPKRMLRHRALIQGGRVAFGFSGIYTDGDEPATIVQQDGGELARNVTLPSRQEVAEVAHDAETGEVLDEDAARELDRQGFAAMEGRSDEDHGDGFDVSADEIIAFMAKKITVIDVNSLVSSHKETIMGMQPEDRDRIAQAQAQRIEEIKGLV